MKINIEEIKKRILEKHGNVVKIIENTYQGVCKRATFVDKDFGLWITEVKSVLRGRGHPTRGYLKNTLTIEEVEERLKKIYGDLITVDRSTYINTQTRCIFVDKDFGIFEAIPNNIFKKGHFHPKRYELRILEKYGVKNVTQNREIALRAVKTIAIIKQHWKTAESLICQGSYESKTVDYLNSNKIDFEWQSKVFPIPNGKTYRPDLFLIKENKWIEIKGFFRGDAEEKWKWFKLQNPTAELWNKEKLKELGIL